MLKIKNINDIFQKALTSGCTPKKLTLSVCIGAYIAFSPFPGAHTLMMVAAKYLFNLHFPTLFIVTSINNPWTMVPFFSLDYAFGYWFVHSLLGLNPDWTLSLVRIFGSGSICIWSFLIGGNILGIIAAAFCYPCARTMFAHISRKNR